MKRILLMTGTIKPHCEIAYNKVEVRAREYLVNIERYIKNSDFHIIVFAENSGYLIDEKKYATMAIEYGKIFEYLDLSDVAVGRNISVGDALIMRHAIEKSKYITNESSIWKVSERIYIRNINHILRWSETDKENTFLYSKRYDSIQTWFFRASVYDLKNYFLSDYSINKMETSCIEYIFTDVYRSYKEKIRMNRFCAYPNAEGINSSGQPYTLPMWKLLAKNILLKIGRFDIK